MTATPTESARLVLGSMTFGDTVDAATAAEMIRVATDAGIRMIDTANGYAGGATEVMLGELLPSLAPTLRVATKAGMPHPDAGDDSPLSPRALRRSVEGSLRRLRRDAVDLFYLHQPDRLSPLDDTLGTVADLMAEGKIASYGVSNFAAWQIAQIHQIADTTGMQRPVVAQQLYNLVARRIEAEYTDFARSTGLRTMVYNPLGGGLLSGAHSLDHKPESGRFGDSRLAAMYTQRYWNDDLLEAVRQLTAVADDAGIPLSELALRWLLSSADVDTVLLGGSKVAHLRANIAAAARGPLPAAVIAACDRVGAHLAGPMPAYNR
ncbi:aldo/keto reductase [Microbacterium sp. NPDC089189]|uniref:aldo/keto reductase n=1 Tax=Microbacterium sp. NPDC089189 TaxID=3154972 RepID=UPI003413EC2A